MTFSIRTLNITIKNNSPSITTLSIMTSSIELSVANAKSGVFDIVKLRVIILRDFILSVIMLSVVMLNVIMLSVVAPSS
jgi:hypothetical protein